MKTMHEQDCDCTVDPETNCCTVCGVEHSDPCDVCGGRGFHKFDCSKNETGRPTIDMETLKQAEEVIYIDSIETIPNKYPDLLRRFIKTGLLYKGFYSCTIGNVRTLFILNQ